MKNKAGIEYIRALIARGESVLRQIEESGRTPNNKKILERRWSLKEAELFQFNITTLKTS